MKIVIIIIIYLFELSVLQQFSTQCQLGQLNLKSYLVNEEKTFVYCGQYDDMINYSNSRKVYVTIFAKKTYFL